MKKSLNSEYDNFKKNERKTKRILFKKQNYLQQLIKLLWNKAEPREIRSCLLGISELFKFNR